MKIEIGPSADIGLRPQGFRKVDIQIDPWDTWGLDHTLSLIIVPCLKQLKATSHGYPSDLTVEKWDEIQDKMIWTFEQLAKDDDLLFDVDELNCIEKTQKDNEKIQEGLDFFSKYFRDLWD